MEEKGWKYFVVLFHLLCWASTISIISYWIYLYSLNEDSTVIHYKKYYHDESIQYPTLSLCFKTPFNKTRLEDMSININASSYLEFLEGKHFRTDMPHYDYQNIINNISEYIGAVNIVFKENRWEIGKYIGNSNYHGKGIAKNSTISMINYFKKYFPFYNELYARTREDNKINIELNKRIGFTIYKHVANNYILMKKII